MDRSFREQESGTQPDPKRFLFLVSLPILTSIIERLTGLIKLTEEQQEETGIYPDRLGCE